MRGWLRIVPFNDPHESILTGQPRWWLRGPGGCRLLAIEQSRVHGDDIVAKAGGLDDRDHAQALKGCEVMISRAQFPGAPAGEVYWVDLIGCTVRNPAGEWLGVVTAVDAFGADPVLRLDAPGEAPGSNVQRLIPFVPAFIVEVDVAGRKVVADWELDY